MVTKITTPLLTTDVSHAFLAGLMVGAGITDFTSDELQIAFSAGSPVIRTPRALSADEKSRILQVFLANVLQFNDEE